MKESRKAINQLREAIMKAPYGAKYSYEDLSAIAGIDVKDSRFVITAAGRLLEKYHERRLKNVRGYGYMVDTLEGLEIPAAEEGYLIRNVLDIEDSAHGEGNRALMVIYEPLNDKEEGIKRALPMDSAIIKLLKSRVI